MSRHRRRRLSRHRPPDGRRGENGGEAPRRLALFLHGPRWLAASPCARALEHARAPRRAPRRRRRRDRVTGRCYAERLRARTAERLSDETARATPSRCSEVPCRTHRTASRRRGEECRAWSSRPCGRDSSGPTGGSLPGGEPGLLARARPYPERAQDDGASRQTARRTLREISPWHPRAGHAGAREAAQRFVRFEAGDGQVPFLARCVCLIDKPPRGASRLASQPCRRSAPVGCSPRLCEPSRRSVPSA